MDLHGFMKVLARRWPTVLVCLVLAVGAALAATNLTTPVYEARTQLFVATRTGEDTTQLSQGQTFSQARVQSYAAIVPTRQVTKSVVRGLKLRTTPEELASRITAEAPLDTVLINITVRDTVPSRAARIANAVAAHFTAVVEQLERPAQMNPQRAARLPYQPDVSVSPVSLGITQQAVPPADPVSPRPLLNLTAGVLGGLLLGAGLVVLRENLDTSIKTSQALSESTGLPGLGSIPYDRNAPKQPLVTADGHSWRAEAFRKLRANLQFAQVDDRPRIIMVTSSVPGEGKTTTAVNLALSLAEAGMSTCLVDCDLRRPAVAKALGLVEDAGLTTVLIGQSRVEEVMQQVGSCLSVLASGAAPPNPTELLASARMGEVLGELATTYEAVIVDTAPLLPVADTVGLAPLTQGSLLVVRASKTSRDQVRTATEALERVGSRILGTVFNMAATSQSDCYGGYMTYSELPTPRVSAHQKVATMLSVTDLTRKK
ncbi:polysaccharide biosynthesis tyrosine autokinase [Streptomyces sp. NPDC006365]|uniref:polysaccharide biosynthesis tyrosine autokinase n=1 Tax=Streptomyces sp. NPDC006365 TaxID=3364744 RepID=UPI003678D8EC